MKKVLATDIVQGMVAAKDIYNSQNLLVIQQGTVFDDRAISKLMVHGIVSAMIVDEKGPVRPAPKEPSYYQKIRESKEFQEFKEKSEAKRS